MSRFAEVAAAAAFRDRLRGFPALLTDTSEQIRIFLLFSFLFSTFLFHHFHFMSLSAR